MNTNKRMEHYSDYKQQSDNINVEIKKGKLKRIKKYLSIFNECKHDNYISHGEVLSGRATSELKWADNIITQMRQEFIHYLVIRGYEIFEVILSSELIGFTTIKIFKRSKSALLLDIMIKKEYQCKGIGKKILHKIEDYLRNENIGILILESGIRNDGAHHFFEKNGYTKISFVYSKKLKCEK